MEDWDTTKKLVVAACALGTVYLLGTLGYVLIEGWSVFDALYMTTITLATVGYGETHALSNAGRAFTMTLILGGLGVAAYSISALTALLIEGDLSQAFRRRRMETRVKALEGHYIVCGAGHTGQTIIEELAKTRRPFVVVEKDPERAERWLAEKYLVVQGDSLEDETLEKAGVQRARGLFCALGEDSRNAFLVISARGLNGKLRIISEVEDVDVREKLMRSGADSVVSSGHIGGLRLVSEMVRPVAVGFLDSMIRDRTSVYRFEEVEVPAGSSLVGSPTSEVKGAEGGAALVVAIKDPGQAKYEINPPPDRPLKAGEVLVLLGSIDEVRRLRERMRE